MLHSNSAIAKLFEEPESRRKSSWSNFLNRPEEESFDRPSNRTFSKVAADYNIEDYLPKRSYRRACAAPTSHSLFEEDINMPFILTARFPEPGKGKENSSANTNNLVAREEHEKLAEENKRHKQQVDELQQAIENLKSQKNPVKLLGWSQRIEVKVVPKVSKHTH